MSGTPSDLTTVIHIIWNTVSHGVWLVLVEHPNTRESQGDGWDTGPHSSQGMARTPASQ